MTVTKVGRRYYFFAAPYSAKDILKRAGCRWDPERRAWWTGKKDLAEELKGKLETTPQGERRDETVTLDSRVIRGRVEYKGKTYYMLAQRRDRTGCKLAFRDGSRVFWTRQGTPFTVLKIYDEPRSISELRAYAERRKQERGDRWPAARGYAPSHDHEDCRCYCHRESNAGEPGSILYDGCDRCGCET